MFGRLAQLRVSERQNAPRQGAGTLDGDQPLRASMRSLVSPLPVTLSQRLDLGDGGVDVLFHHAVGQQHDFGFGFALAAFWISASIEMPSLARMRVKLGQHASTRSMTFTRR